MKELLFTKAVQGLIPAMDETQEWFVKKKLGATILMDAREMRNGAFFRKWWSLVKYAYDEWSELHKPQEYKGMVILPDFDRFRRDVIIVSGFRRPVWNIKGEMRLEHESLKWASMDEERFAKLYDATLQALTQQVFNGEKCRKLRPQDLKAIHDHIWEYAA